MCVLVQVLKVVRQSLQDLLLAIEGTIIMSASLKDMLDAMYDARVPEHWRKVSATRDRIVISMAFTLMCQKYLSMYNSLFCNTIFYFLHSFFAYILTSTLSPGVMGVQHTWVLVHRAAGERCTIPSLVHIWATQGILDHWILQPSGIPHCDETGHL